MTSGSPLGYTPLQGLTVLDLSQGVAGPYCTQLLGHQGAKVIKIEPLEGDWGRHVGVSQNGHSTLSCTYNSGKQSLAVDARQPEGKALILQLAKKADVVVQNFRPPVVKRLGLDYETLRSHGFDPVYVSISGYGADGPYADHPATDSVMQADSGLMHTNRDEQNMPQRVGVLLADIATGVYAAQACTAALLHRFRFGTGTHVEINLFNVCCALQSTAISEEVIAGQIDKQAASAPNGVFEAADGKIAVLALSNDHFLRISEALGLPHWRTDPRFATNELRLQHKAELHADLVAALRRHTVAELEALFQQHSVLHARVRTANDVVHHPQAQHLSTFLSMKQPDFGDVLLAATPWPRAHLAPPAAPRAGEHSARILADLGLSSHEIESLAERRIIGL